MALPTGFDPRAYQCPTRPTDNRNDSRQQVGRAPRDRRNVPHMHRLDADDIRCLLEATPAHFCKTSRDGIFLWLSSGWPELLGCSMEDLLGRSFMSLVHPDDRTRTLAAMSRLDAGHPVVGFSNRYATGGGEYIWIRWFSSAYEDFYYAVATVQDESRDEATQLRESRHLLELTEELGEIGHWRLELVSDTLFWSKQVFKIHGLDPESFRPTLTSAIEAYHPEDRPIVQQQVSRAIERKEGFQMETRLIRSDGQVRTVVSRGRVECNPEGEVTSLIGIFQDVTDWKKMEARLRETERLHGLSTLAAGVAHEINNPLQYITSTLEVARIHLEDLNGEGASHRLDELLSDVEQGVEQVSRVVTELRTFVKNDASESREPVSLVSVLNTTLSMTRNDLRHRTELTTRIGQLPMVSASYSELVQVFVNLVTNAIQALAEADGVRFLRVSASTRDDGWAVVDVENSGPGIAPGDLTRIFEPFFTTKGPGEGTGLGLYLSRSIIQRSGGTIDAESNPGGTRFRVTLPPADLGESEVDQEPDDGRARLLVVDDDALVLRALSALLEGQYSVTTETDPDAALQRLRVGQRFDLLLLDVMMPRIDGWTVLAEVARLAPELAKKTVVMTGALDASRTPERFANTFVLAKPFRNRELIDLLDGLSSSD